MAEIKAVEVLLDSTIAGGKIYNEGDIILEATDEMLAAADEKRKGRDGIVMFRRLSKTEALKAAKRADSGDDSVIVAPEEPEVVPVEEPEVEVTEDDA